MLVEMARLPDCRRVPARVLGESLGIPQPFARRIVSELAAAGLVDTRRGTGGGVGLARDPATITLTDVITATEGGVFLNACTRDQQLCGLSSRCAAHAAWQRAEALLVSYLTTRDIASLAAASDAATDPPMLAVGVASGKTCPEDPLSPGAPADTLPEGG
jgi:Rrf2 family protein